MRLAVTQDIDTTMLTTAEFYFKYGCDDRPDSFGSVDRAVVLGSKDQGPQVGFAGWWAA